MTSQAPLIQASYYLKTMHLENPRDSLFQEKFGEIEHDDA